MIYLEGHNIPVYRKLEAKMKEVHRCALVAATGTGKSYITARYVCDYDLQTETLILVPNRAVMKTWKNLLPDTDIMTYQGMMLKRPNFSMYKLIICDEMHHLGADNWGEVFRELATHPEQKILGLTATPIRYLNDNRNMVTEFFDGNLVEGVQLSEAIRDEILPSFEYITALYDVPKRKKSKDTTTEKLYTKLDLMSNEYSFRKILEKHLEPKPFPQIKAVVFVPSVAEIDEIRDICKEAFPKALHLAACSKYKDEENQEAYQVFEEDTFFDTFLYVVDILNEGRHLKGANVEIMFRRTRSPIVYLQQLGRILDSGNKSIRVKVFDFVANHTNMREYTDLKKNTVTWINDGIGKSDRQIIQYDYAMKELELLEKIRVLESGYWTKEEDELMFQYYKEKGADYLHKILPDRSKVAIISHAKILGLAKVKEKYPDGFLEDLKTYYGKEDGWDILLEKYPQYSKAFITNVANRNGLTTRSRSESWSLEEDNILKENGTLPIKELMELLPKRSKASITGRKHLLGITSRTIHNWTEEEIDILRNNQESTAKELKERYFPYLDKDTINRARTRFSCSRNTKWDEARIQLFCQLYKNGGYAEVLSHPEFSDMTKSAVNGAAIRYKVRSEKKRTGTWTEAEKAICRRWLSLPEDERPSKQSLAEKIPNHTKNGINDMLRRLQKEMV